MLTLFAILVAGAGIGSVASRTSTTFTTIGVILILAGFVIAVYGWRRPVPPFAVVYCYERGAVVHHASDRVAAHPWSALVPYEWSQRISVGQAANEHVICWLEVRTVQNEVVAVFSQEAARRVSHQIAQVHLVAADEALARDEEVRYAAFRLTRQNIAVGGHILLWSAVRSIRPEGDQLVVYQQGRRRPVIRVDRKTTPHEGTLLALAARLPTGDDPPGSAG